MKLILAIISTDDTKACISSLNKASFHVTRLATTGGFLSSGNTTLIIGCEDKEVKKAIEIIGSESQRRKENFMLYLVNIKMEQWFISIRKSWDNTKMINQRSTILTAIA